MIFEICWILAMHLPHRTGNPDFMGQPSREKRIEQLLYSIYTFQCEQVLNVLLLEQLHLNNDRALRLLDPEDAARKQYIHYIQQKIQSLENTQAEQVSAPNSAMAVKSASKRLLRRLLGDF